MVHVVIFELKPPHDSRLHYEQVTKAMNEVGACILVDRSTWLVDTTFSVVETRNRLKGVVAEGDAVFVGQLQGNWAAGGVGARRSEWLRLRNF